MRYHDLACTNPRHLDDDHGDWPCRIVHGHRLEEPVPARIHAGTVGGQDRIYRETTAAVVLEWLVDCDASVWALVAVDGRPDVVDADRLDLA